MKFAVIGNPIDKSLSPQLHNILYEKLNISSCSFEKICLEVDELDNFFNNDLSQFNGINVTIPFKSKVVKFWKENLNYCIETMHDSSLDFRN